MISSANSQRLHSVVDGDSGDGGIKAAFKRFGIGTDAHTHVYAKTACVHKDDSFDKDKVNIYFGLVYEPTKQRHNQTLCVCSMPCHTLQNTGAFHALYVVYKEREREGEKYQQKSKTDSF